MTRRQRGAWHKDVHEPKKRKRELGKPLVVGESTIVNSCDAERTKSRFVRMREHQRAWFAAEHEFQMRLGTHRIGPIVKMKGWEAYKKNRAFERKFIDSKVPTARLMRWVLASGRPDVKLPSSDEQHYRVRQRKSYYRNSYDMGKMK